MKNLREAISSFPAHAQARVASFCDPNGPSAGASERVIETVRQIAASSFQPGLRSLVLTGSLARNEGTWLPQNGRERLAGDAEFLAVFGQHAQVPTAIRVASVEREIETRLHDSELEVHIGLSSVGPGYLRTLQPHIFAYELLERGRVIWGEEKILDLVPRFSPADIPLEDGLRMLMNRIVELLEALCSCDTGRTADDLCRETVYYCAIKLWLDMATSFLLFQGEYESTYGQRAEKLSRMATDPDVSGKNAPIPLERFAARVRAATDYKLGTTCLAGINAERARSGTGQTSVQRLFEMDQDGGGLYLRGLIKDAHSLWRWELKRLTGLNADASDDELLDRWLKLEELAGRIRGWAATAKRYGLWPSARMVPRWVRLGLKGSPRRLVYAAASELFFGLKEMLSENGNCWYGAETRVGQRIHELPLTSNSETEASWRIAGRTIARNYHLFLESTRS